MSRFCSFVSFLIGSPFMRLSSTGRNDTDDFFALFLIESMDDQENRTGAYGSNGYPPPLIFRSRVALGKSKGIIETSMAVSKRTSCLRRFCRFFCSSHSNRITWPPPRQHMGFSYTCQYICTYIAPQYEPEPASNCDFHHLGRGPSHPN